MDHRRSGAEAVYAALDAAPAAVVGVDARGRIDYLNPLVETVFGYRPEELLGRSVDLLVPERSRGQHAAHRHGFAQHRRVRPVGLGRGVPGRRKDGQVFPAEIQLIPLETEEGPWVIATINDITARHEAQRRLEDLSRAYLTLAEINQAIVRAPDELTLYTRTCRVAVDQGGYLGAWVGTVAADRTVRKVASAGSLDEYADLVALSLDGPLARGQESVARQLAEGRIYFCDDFLADPLDEPWQQLASRHGIRSWATLPLRRSGETVALLTLYSDQQDVFDDEVRSLLATVAENVSFALERIAAGSRLRAVATQRRHLSRRLIAAQEEERARIAADMHDDPVQSLAAVDLRLGLLQRQLVREAPELVADVRRVQTEVERVSAGLRDLLFELETGDTGTVIWDLLAEAAGHLLEPTGIGYRHEVDTSRWDHASVLSPADRGQALRMFKEALVAIRARGDAGQVLVRVVPGLDGVEVAVTESGAPPSAEAEHALRRLAEDMHDRAVVSGGWCRAETGEHGNTVRFWLPFDPTEPPYMGRRY